MSELSYPHEGRDLRHWSLRLGSAGKLRHQKVSDGRRIKPGATTGQPSLRTSCELLLEALDYLHERDLRFFRLPSTFCPYPTHPDHPDYAYELQREAALDLIEAVAAKRERYGIEFSFHPSQYILLSSSREELTRSSVQELEWQVDLLDRFGVDPSMRVFLHGGGVYGEREATKARLIANVAALPAPVKRRFAFENDEYSWNAEQLLEICSKSGVPFVLDLHHHLLNPGTLTWQEAIERAIPTWGELRPKIHLSSPKDPEGTSVSTLRAHHDFIDPSTARSLFAYLDDHGHSPWVMLEAKAKEDAVLELRKALAP